MKDSLTEFEEPIKKSKFILIPIFIQSITFLMCLHSTVKSYKNQDFLNYTLALTSCYVVIILAIVNLYFHYKK